MKRYRCEMSPEFFAHVKTASGKAVEEVLTNWVPWLSPAMAADRLGISESKLKQLRRLRKGPSYSIRYTIKEIDDWKAGEVRRIRDARRLLRIKKSKT